jgi:hypothetical protein
VRIPGKDLSVVKSDEMVSNTLIAYAPETPDRYLKKNCIVSSNKTRVPITSATNASAPCSDGGLPPVRGISFTPT